MEENSRRDFNEYQQIVADANTASRTLQKKVEEAAAKSISRLPRSWRDKVDKVQENAFAKMNALIRKNADNVFAAHLQTAGSERIMELETPEGDLRAFWTRLKRQLLKDSGRTHRWPREGKYRRHRPDFTPDHSRRKTSVALQRERKTENYRFLASWCGPCRMENPNMVKLYNDFKDKGLAIVSVSLDERKVPWVQAIKEGRYAVDNTSLRWKGWKCEVVKQYNIDAVPSIIVLDENNRILAKNIRAEKLRAFVTEYLN